MRALLRYANSAEVARGLTKRGYPVDPSTISRWAKGQKVTPLQVKLVEELLLDALGHQETAAPDWGRLQDTLDAIAKKLGVSLVAEAERSADVAVDEALEQPPAGGVPGDPRSRARHAKR